MVSTPLKRAKLRSLYAGITTSGKTLLEALQAANDTAISAVQSGRAITQSAGNGFSAVYELLKGFSPTDAVELAEDLMTRYEAAAATGLTTDALIYAEMMAMLDPVTEVYTDFTQISRV